jgi:acyl-coenzyme A synthetase/AMP-(fatty) acid ligase
VKDQLAAYAAPRELVLTDVLPTTSIGKVRRQALR